MAADMLERLKGREGLPRHVAIIMDGNGRWAEHRGLPRAAGHRKGVESLREIVRTCGKIGIDYLTLFSFSSENWSRPEGEVKELFSLLRRFVRRDLADLHKNNVRVLVIGETAGVPDDIVALLQEAQKLTAGNDSHTLVIAFNYGGRAEIAGAARSLARQAVEGNLDPEAIDETMFGDCLLTRDIPDPDLFIRTSGELRLSNFLLWQLAYTELYFTECLWPDFGPAEFCEAIETYLGRNRTFGGLSEGTGA